MNNKRTALRVLMLFSAFESMLFAHGKRIPDHLLEEMNDLVIKLSAEITDGSDASK